VSEPVVSDRKRRTNRFDRPKEPHDWRWAVGNLGRILIAIGLLMFAFVSYQLWGTGIQTAQAQNRLENEFEDLLGSTTSVPVTTTTAPPPTTTTPPDESVPQESTTTVVTTTTLPPPIIEAPAEGEPLARLEIESIGLDWIVVSGVSASDLQDGPGHFPETPLPGQVGNSAIAGHRTTHGQPFFRIDEVEVGDDIVLTTLAGRYVYVMTSQQLVAPSDYAAVIPAVDPTKATITLVSCHPRYSTRQRIFVHAELDPTRSDPITAAAPPRTEEPSALPDETLDTEVATMEPSNTEP
jgi:sortase A